MKDSHGDPALGMKPMDQLGSFPSPYRSPVLPIRR
jgi:hypothetical protein